MLFEFRETNATLHARKRLLCAGGPGTGAFWAVPGHCSDSFHGVSGALRKYVVLPGEICRVCWEFLGGSGRSLRVSWAASAAFRICSKTVVFIIVFSGTWASSDFSGLSLGSLKEIWDALQGVVGRSWTALGMSFEVLSDSLRLLQRLLGGFRIPRGSLRVPWGPLGVLGDALERVWSCLRNVWDDLGGFLGPLWGVLGVCFSVCLCAHLPAC